jgi:Response regulator containing a CheY-like receiver domain and an HTH DNA-binding domain
MKPEINKMLQVWDMLQNEIVQPVPKTKVQFDEIVSAIFAAGPFYYYFVDLPEMHISNISSGFEELHGIPVSEIHSIRDVLALIHPDDMDLVAKAEEKAHLFIYQKGIENLTRYKVSYNFRFRTADGGYRLFNHQSLVLSVDQDNNAVRSINIHTDISHMTNINNHRWSAIGLAGEPSYLNMDVWNDGDTGSPARMLSKRELNVLDLIVKGHSSREIAGRLGISPETVKAHRKNILQKSGCNNMAELAARSISEGWV